MTVVKMQELVAHVRHPVEVAENAIGETMTPCTQQHRANDAQRNVSEDGKAKREGNVKSHP